MEHILELGTTPSIPLKTAELIADYARRVPSDTTAWRQTCENLKNQSTETVFLAEGTSISSLTGTASFGCGIPKDKAFPVITDIAMPIIRDMTHLITGVALHNAMTLRGEVLLTETVPGFALKGALYFAETYTMGRRQTTARVSWLDSEIMADVPLTEEVLAFASAHALRAYLADTLNMIRRIFTNVSGLQIQYEHDNETEQEWLSIGVTVSGEIDQILEQYDSCIKQFNRLVPWPTRSLIRLNYDIK